MIVSGILFAFIIDAFTSAEHPFKTERELLKSLTVQMSTNAVCMYFIFKFVNFLKVKMKYGLSLESELGFC